MDKEIYDKAVEEIGITYSDVYQSFVMYKGFKVNKKGEEYEVKNVRRSEFYEDVPENVKQSMVNNGFKKTCLLLNYKENLIRIGDLKKQIKNLYKEYEYYNKTIDEDYAKNKKRMGVALRDIDDCKADLAFYEAKVKEYERLFGR